MQQHDQIKLLTQNCIPKCLTEQMFGRRVQKGYEEVTVPAVKTAAMRSDEQLVKIVDMPPWCQTAFAGYKCGPPPLRFSAPNISDHAV